MKEKLSLKFSIVYGVLYGIFGGIAFASGFINFFNNLEPYPTHKFPLLQPFTKYTFIIALLLGFIVLIAQSRMVLRKNMSFKWLILSIVIGFLGSYLFSGIWFRYIEWVSFLKSKYHIFY